MQLNCHYQSLSRLRPTLGSKFYILKKLKDTLVIVDFFISVTSLKVLDGSIWSERLYPSHINSIEISMGRPMTAIDLRP